MVLSIMMTKSVLTLLIGIVVSSGTSAAFADTFVCKRYTDDPHGFTTYSVFESWFPKRISLEIYDWKSRSDSKALTKEENDRKYRLLPNGKMIAGMKPKPGFKTVDNVRYKCDRTSLQLSAGLEDKSINTHIASAFAGMSDGQICIRATKSGEWEARDYYQRHVQEAKRRGLTCGVEDASSSTQIAAVPNSSGGVMFRNSRQESQLANLKSSTICKTAVDSYTKIWSESVNYRIYVQEAKRRGLSCGVGETTQTASAPKVKPKVTLAASSAAGTLKCKRNTEGHEKFKTQNDFNLWFPEEISLETYDWKSIEGHRSLTKVEKQIKYVLLPSGNLIAGLEKYSASLGQALDWRPDQKKKYFREINRIKYGCNRTSLQLVAGLERQSGGTKTASASKATSTALTAVEKEAERLRQELASLKAKQQPQKQTLPSDTQIPIITITQLGANGRKGSVKGYARDNVQVAEVLIDGQAVRLGNDGSFEWSGFVPSTGKKIVIEAIDTSALSSTEVISLKRDKIQQASGPRFDDLDPTAGKRVKPNSNALALIVGISDYERTDAPAVYADKDAQYFHDYASLKLGIPDNKIKTMVNAKAEQGDVILAVKDWIRRSSIPGKTDVYVFFAGHGLASDNGEQMYLLPYDGRPRLLNKTAILRQELFDDIAAANPRSVTIFLDTCYSGATRGTDMLISSRPIAIKAVKQSIPNNFTVMTAAAGDQTAKPLEEAKHGMFSYFLMKGMEGDADQDSDKKITAGELHQYVQSNVVQQSSGSQTPELQGDSERVLVRFQ